MTTQVCPDLSEFEAAMDSRPSRCWRAVIGLTDEQATRVDAALATTHITGTAISAVLKGWGFEVKPSQVQRHRNGGCTCD